MNLEELGGPDVTLDHIVKDLLSFFNGFECLHEAKRMIEERCAIKKEPEHKCWPEDKIKQAWEETIKEDIKSSTRRHWARVIMLQVVKSFVCDTCKQNTAQKSRHDTTDEQGCDIRRTPEDGSSQSKAEPETVGAAGGHEQMFGEGKKVSIVSKLTEESGATLESQLSAVSKDEAPSPAEVNSNKCETRNAALVNENEDTLVKNSEQQKDIDYYEFSAADVHDKENV